MSDWKLTRSDALYPPEEQSSQRSEADVLRARVSELEGELARLRSGKSGHDVLVPWRGSVCDLVTDLVPLLTVEQLAELAGEVALAWREKRLKAGSGQGGAGGHG